MNISPADWGTLSKLLDEAFDLPPEARATWLEETARARPALAPALRQLLAAHAVDETADVLATLPALDASDAPPSSAGEGQGDAATRDSDETLHADDRVGPYRLVRRLGAGGMADVWLAVRVDGVIAREVALKLPRITRLRRDLAARFAREREILARLEHPHIARLYDAGIADDGLPWLAMEFVAGDPIDAWCDARKLDVAGRVRLFLQVLEAVQYAHANLVVHRDLKPSNILVTGDGQVRLLDFGIAKLLADDETARETHLTQVAGRALTPDFASPEQIRGDPLTTASDTYSLGVVLYELLAGRRPYRLKIESVAQLELAILEAEPGRPSQQIDAAVAAARGAEARTLVHALEGDLDTIVLKALAKEPAARDATVAALAEDLQRFLDGRPVLAQPPSFAYRARKFVRRNRVAVGAATAGGLLLLALTGVSLWQAKAARDQAAAAAREARRAEAVQTFLLDLFRANSDRQQDPARARNTTARELLDLGTERLQSELKDQPEARAEVMRTLSDMYYELQLDEQASGIERQRVALLKNLYGNDDRRVAEALIALAANLHATAHRDEILPALEEAKRILDANGDTGSRLRAELFTRLAQRHQNISFEKMRGYADEAVRILTAYETPDEDRMSTALHLAARARVQLGEFADGERLYRRSIDELRKSKPVPQVALLQAAVALSEAVAAQQHFDLAIAELRQAGETARETLGPNDPGTIVAESRLAALLHTVGRRDEARHLHEDALKRVLAVKGDDDTLYTPIVRADWGRSLLVEGRLKDAEENIGRVVEIDRRHYPRSAVLGNVLRTRAAIETARGHYAEARALFAEATAAWNAGTGAGLHPSRANRFLLDEARLDLAMNEPARAVERLKNVTPPLGADTLEMRSDEIERDILVAAATLQTGNAARALSLAREAHTAVVTSTARTMFPVLEADASLQLARALLANGKTQDARMYAERTLTLRRQFGDGASPWLAEAHLVLADALRVDGITGRADENTKRGRAILASIGDVGQQFRGQIDTTAPRAALNPK